MSGRRLSALGRQAIGRLPTAEPGDPYFFDRCKGGEPARHGSRRPRRNRQRPHQRGLPALRKRPSPGNPLLLARVRSAAHPRLDGGYQHEPAEGSGGRTQRQLPLSGPGAARPRPGFHYAVRHGGATAAAADIIAPGAERCPALRGYPDRQAVADSDRRRHIALRRGGDGGTGDYAACPQPQGADRALRRCGYGQRSHPGTVDRSVAAGRHADLFDPVRRPRRLRILLRGFHRQKRHDAHGP